jgi:hypothetical protein
MKKYIRASIDKEQEQKYYALGKEIEKELIESNIDTYLASVWDNDTAWVISFWADDLYNRNKIRRLAYLRDEVVAVRERAVGDNGWYVDCYIV